MGTEHEIQKTACPIPQMSFGDISRYLQGGFDAAVHRAVSGHVMYCNSCRDELDRVKSLRKAGRHMMVSRLQATENRVEQKATDHVDDVTLAAYVDNGLGEAERKGITEHISNCHSCYLQYSALQKELESPVPRPLRAPAEVTATMKLPVAAPRETVGLAEIGRRVVNAFDNLVSQRWTQPALAFAMGVIVMLMFLPSPKTVVPLPGFSPVQSGFDDKVRSSVDGQQEVVDNRPVILIPADAQGKLEFTWPGETDLRDGVYRIEIFNAANEQVLDSKEVTENKWVADVSIFLPGLRYEILVSRIGNAGGVQPISQ
ncbi:MAG: zf-HC2 domain-containing protein, partial [Rhodothermales bacterium]|nr:zf-HC2 domain-containing protein [Rhodothermales bacterium]